MSVRSEEIGDNHIRLHIGSECLWSGEVCVCGVGKCVCVEGEGEHA